MADIRNFLLNSDYPNPFIVWKLETSLVVPVGTYWNAASKEIQHGLPFTPWIIGQWSTNSNFVPAYDLANDMPIFTGTRPDLQVMVGSDSSTIKLTAQHVQENPVTFYFRIFSFLPPDYTGTWTNNIDDSTNFRLSTDFNYPKVLASGSLSVATGSTSEYYHNLGYLPQVRAWREVTTAPFDNYQTMWNILIPAPSTTNSDGLFGVSVTDSVVKFGNQSTSGSDMVYKYIIFGDEV